jgi:hypothetical protein
MNPISGALLTWDDLYGDADEDDLEEHEFGLEDVNIKPDTYEDIIDEHMEKLVSLQVSVRKLLMRRS